MLTPGNCISTLNGRLSFCQAETLENKGNDKKPKAQAGVLKGMFVRTGLDASTLADILAGALAPMEPEIGGKGCEIVHL